MTTIDALPKLEEQLRADLLAKTPARIVSEWMLSRVPHVFDNNLSSFLEWREMLARGLGVDANEIVFVGSSATGVSFNPTNHFKLFDSESDVDVAVISTHHFELAWRSLRALPLSKLTRDQALSIKDHRTRLIYWQTVAADQILELLPFGESWLEALARMATVKPTIGRDIKARIYRDFSALRSYQETAISALREELHSKG